jgi:two-component system cell cycle response regulator
MQVSLRAKITLALLVTGLTSAVLVGVIARAILMQQFTAVVLDNSFRTFAADVERYVEEFGSWEEGHKVETFGAWNRRRGRGAGPRGRGDGGFNLLPPPPGRGGVDGGAGRQAGPRGGAAAGAPPFLFMILDPAGNPLQGPWEPRTFTQAQIQEIGRPIRVDGKVVAIAMPLDDPNLTTFDRTYLDAMQSSVEYGVAGAALLALALGFFFSGRLSANVHRLTGAIQAMTDGELRQKVHVKSRDEIGFLADAFNRMSDTIHQQSEQLKELVIRDELTRLHNRFYFNAHAAVAFAQAERYARPFSVAIGDIDHFKQINDTFSHAVGDEVLRRVARLLADSTRESDIVARYGGEEFVVAFAETALADAAATCERIRAAIEIFPWDEVQPGLRVTITIGVDGHVGRGSIEAMLAAADARLYQGKKAGRNRVCAETQQTTA